MILFYLIAPALIMFVLSFLHHRLLNRILPITTLMILIPIVYLFRLEKPYTIIGNYWVATQLNSYILLISSIVAIGVTFALVTLKRRVRIENRSYVLFYRFFALFWIGLIISILANNMGIYWIGLEMATLSTVYMIKTNQSKHASKEAWNYMIVGAIAISLILFGIILIYASAKPILGEDAMNFALLQEHINEIKNPFLFELGFVIVSLGMFIKMGFFPMNLWLANIERASFYPVAALFSGILESAILVGFFHFSTIAIEIDRGATFSFVFIYLSLTLFLVSFLIYRSKDFMRLFSLSGVEHMILIILFWISGGYYAALLHFGAHAFLKPALFLSTGVLESNGQYKISGTLRGYQGWRGKSFAIIVGLFLLAIIGLPPSPMFFSEIYGFEAIIHLANQEDYYLWIIAALIVLLLLLSIIFYKFIEIYQSMRYEGEAESKIVYTNEWSFALLFLLATLTLLLPQTTTYLKAIYG